MEGVSPSSAAFAFWMCLNHAGELNLCSMICVDNSMSEIGTDGGSCDATIILRTLVPHLPNDLDQSSYEVGAVDVLVGLVEDNQFVESTSLVGRLREHLKQNDE